MQVLDLFSGIGGFSLGLERAGFKTAAFCEIDPYCRKVLAKHWPGVKIHEDIKQLDGEQYYGAIDVICGGYPCQPFSVAGKQAGEKDPRHLWPEMLRIIRGCRPRWVICENVSGHVKLGFDTVAAQLEAEGFTVWPFLIPACAVGAPHRRERLWVVGYAEHHGSFAPAVAGGIATAGHDLAEGKEQASQLAGAGRSGGCSLVADGLSPRLEGHAGHGNDWHQPGRLHPKSNRPTGKGGLCETMADTQGERCDHGDDGELQRQGTGKIYPFASTGGHSGAMEAGGWQDQRGLGRGFNGISGWLDGTWEDGIPRIIAKDPDRTNRLKALGNSVVPQIPELIGRTIIQYERNLARAA